MICMTPPIFVIGGEGTRRLRSGDGASEMAGDRRLDALWPRIVRSAILLWCAPERRPSSLGSGAGPGGRRSRCFLFAPRGGVRRAGRYGAKRRALASAQAVFAPCHALVRSIDG